MKWSDGEVIIVAFVDITPQKLLEEDLSFLNSILRHDISNEITIIMNYLELYKEDKSDEFLKKIEESVKRIVNIINNVRNFEEAIKGKECDKK